MNADTKILDVINHPTFEGFGSFLFSTDYRTPEESATLRDVGSLLPYHSHIDVNTTVDVLNSMMDRVSDGETIFYDIYSDEEKQADPSKAAHP